MWYLAAVIIIVMCIMGFLYLSQGRGEFIYQEHLQDAAFKVNGQEITLKEASYYIMVIESNVNGFAVQYDAGFPKRYWNVYLNDGGNRSNFLNDQAEEDTKKACIRDAIYYNEAVNAGIELDASEEKKVMEDAFEQESLMTGKMLEKTRYEYSDLCDAIRRIAIIKKYMTELMKRGYTQDELDFGGSYYESVEKGYDIWTNDELWDEITLGSVTIN